MSYTSIDHNSAKVMTYPANITFGEFKRRCSEKMSCTTTRLLQLVVERLKWRVRFRMTSLCVQRVLDMSPRAAKDAGASWKSQSL